MHEVHLSHVYPLKTFYDSSIFVLLRSIHNNSFIPKVGDHKDRPTLTIMMNFSFVYTV